MSLRCEQYDTDVAALVHGELAPLAAERLRLHLSHCRSCAQLHDTLAQGTAAARAQSPTLTKEQIDRLVVRMAPYLPPVRPSAMRCTSWLLAGGFAAVASSVALVAVFLSTRPDRGPAANGPTAQPQIRSATGLASNTAATSTDDTAGAATSLGSGSRGPTPLHEEPHVGLRIAAEPEWDGATELRGRRILLHLLRGTVAIALRKTQNRSLHVHVGAVTVEVLGTRFVVQRADNGTVTVSVATGTVAVRVAGTKHVLRRNGALSISQGGQAQPPVVTARALELLEDPFLVGFDARPSALTRGRRASPRAERPPQEEVAAPRDVALQQLDVLSQMQRAEKLKSSGHREAALQIYDACTAAGTTQGESQSVRAYAPYRDLCRLEAARLRGFDDTTRALARAELLHLATHARGEVQRQATMSLCEIDRDTAPCRTKVCLQRLAEAQSAHQSLRDEARRLLSAWSLEGFDCIADPDGENR